ncbi:MAG: septal ring lytic transglycosylase RlpA family protein [Microvirga sp.]
MVAYAVPALGFPTWSPAGRLPQACLLALLTCASATSAPADEAPGAAAAAPAFAGNQGRDLFAPTPFGELQGLAKPASSADADKPAPAAEPLAAPAPLAEAPAPRRALGRGLAAWYDLKNRTASGETFDAGALTAGHRTLPFGTKVEVVNLRNGRAVTVKITDRGPFTRGRVIDLSRAAARAIGMTGIDEVALYAGPQAPEVTATGSVAGRPRPR